MARLSLVLLQHGHWVCRVLLPLHKLVYIACHWGSVIGHCRLGADCGVCAHLGGLTQMLLGRHLTPVFRGSSSAAAAAAALM